MAGYYSTICIDIAPLLFCKLIFVVLAVWAFDTQTECWSLMEAKGDIPVLFYIFFTLSQFKCWWKSLYTNSLSTFFSNGLVMIDFINSLNFFPLQILNLNTWKYKLIEYRPSNFH